MRAELLDIAKAINIQRATLEDDYYYASRIVYSALGAWLKTITFDKVSYSDDTGVSKAHILQRGSVVLSAFLNICPECKPWFLDSDIGDSIREIRQCLLNVGELITKVPDNRIYAIAKDQCLIDKNVVLSFGMPLEQNYTSSGLGCLICSNGEYYESKRFHKYIDKSDDIFNLASVNWKYQEINNTYEIFDPSVKSDKLSDCWITAANGINKGTYYFRNSIMNGNGYEYGLLKAGGRKNVKTVLFPEDICKVLKEHRRLFLLRKNSAGYPIHAYFRNYGAYTEMRMYSRLPKYEEDIIYYLSWPRACLSDKNVRLFHKSLDGYMTNLLNALGVDVVYE